MNILLVATESFPFCKTGGVADVVPGLAKELCAQGHDARVIIPCYRGLLDRKRMQEIVPNLMAPLGTYFRSGTLWKSHNETLNTYLVQQDYYFGRDHIYGYLDDYERFTFFAREALEMLSDPAFRKHEGDWFPQIIQGYDWATGLIPGWLSNYEKVDERFASARFVLFIHNPGRLGIFGSRALRVAQQDTMGTFTQIDETTEHINFLGRGILYADKVVMVNPHYDETNPFPEPAKKSLASVLGTRLEMSDLEGIRNAIDYEEYDPSKDNQIVGCFDERSIRNRVRNKKALQEELGFEQKDDIPLLGMVVSRLTAAAGFDLFQSLEQNILGRCEAQLVVLIDPFDPDFTSLFHKWKQAFDEQSSQLPCQLVYRFDEKLARQIYAGCDIFLLAPKEFPSGIQQFIAMHYGAIPVVHHTGALRDSVIQYEPGMNLRTYHGQSAGIGFAFTDFETEAFSDVVHAAIELYKTDQVTWHEIQRYNMRQDFSWFEPAKRYLDIYQVALQAKRVTVKAGTPLQLDRNAQLFQTIQEIDSLPGVAKRDSEDLLQQAARLVLNVMGCDAVYVWTVKKDIQPTTAYTPYQKMQLVSQSLDRSVNRYNGPEDSSTRLAAVTELLNQGVSITWEQLADFDMGKLCKPISGLGDSELAKKEQWVDGRFVPITVHSRILGRIDVLFRSPVDDTGWLTHALITLANSFAVRLETISLKRESDQILEMDRELLYAHSFSEAAGKICEQARALSHAEEAWLYLLKGDHLEPVIPPVTSDVGLEVARSAITTNEIVYVADRGAAVGNHTTHSPFRSFMAIPLTTDPDDKVVGVLCIASSTPAAFSGDDERILSKHLAPQAAIALQTNLWHRERDQSRVKQLNELATSLIVKGDFSQLLNQVVKTTARVLEAQAASLYLINPATGLLEIRAADGYHEPLLKGNVSYRIGEGTTGWIAQTGEIFKADSAEDLHAKSPWQGKYRALQGDREPKAYLGIPLKIVDWNSGQEQVIGVLKLEDRNENISQSQPIFSDEDVHMGEMMANVIATVIQNTRLADAGLRELSASLQTLSTAMVGGLEMSVLVQRIVETIAEVLGADASALYLLEPDGRTLTAHAATGYQRPLVEKKASYQLNGKGLTAWIAREGKSFKASSLAELHAHSGWAGAQSAVQGGREPSAFLGIPLKVIGAGGREEVIGVLKVEDIRQDSHHLAPNFTEQDELLVEMMGNVIATVIQNTRFADANLREFSASLQTLSIAMVGGLEMSVLVQRIVETIADVLGADASALYLLEPDGRTLTARAATGYQRPLVGKKASYELGGKGLTAWIAREGKPFKASSLAQLHAHPAWAGAQSSVQGGREPSAFLGIPLKVIGAGGREEVIGVLKVEDIRQDSHHLAPNFTEQDELLVEMMGNVIATVIQNTRFADANLREFSANLQALSTAMVGGLEMSVLVQRIVETIAEVLGADASALYLLEPDGRTLTAHAATGYQRPLVEKKVSYELGGKGLTAWIAREGKSFKASSLAELHAHPGWAGAQSAVQGGREPSAFLGIPLKVIGAGGRQESVGVLKIEDIRRGPRHPAPYFTEQDELLVEMMGNVITTVIQNTRLAEDRLEGLLSQALSSILQPFDAISLNVLRPFAGKGQNDLTVIRAVGAALLSALPIGDLAALEAPTRALLKLDMNPELFRIMGDLSKDQVTSHWFGRLHQLSQQPNVDPQRIPSALLLEDRWQKAADALEQNRQEDFSHSIEVLADAIATSCSGRSEQAHSAGKWNAFGLREVLSGAWGIRLPNDLPLLFFRGSRWQQEDLDNLRDLLPVLQEKHFGNVIAMLTFLPKEHWKQCVSDVSDGLKATHADFVFLTLPDLQSLLCADSPQKFLLGKILEIVDLQTVSPYATGGPTADNMFFGREGELRMITEHAATTSYAIIGGRRMGKSSILTRLALSRLPNAGFRTVYHNCINTLDYKTFCQTPLSNWYPASLPDLPATLGDLLASSPTDKKLVLLLDEADKMIPSERTGDWPLFNRLRSLAHSGRAQFIFCGEHTLREALRDSNSPLFNFANEMMVGRLDFNAVKALVTQPMARLRIELDDEDALVRYIYNFTSGHPYVVQSFCNRLIVRLNELNTRVIRKEDIDAVVKDPGFQRKDFLETYWQRATALERIISLLMIDNKSIHTLENVQKALAKQCKLRPDDKEVDAALQRLVDLRAILLHTDAGYEFAVEAFPRVVAATITFGEMLKVWVAEYNKEKAL